MDKAKPERPGTNKKVILEQVAAKTGLKGRDVRLAVDATLAAIREQLLAGNDVRVPPLGKLKVKERTPKEAAEGEAKTVYRLNLADDKEISEDAAEAAS
jgi:DNA-binding protein HU-alpha